LRVRTCSRAEHLAGPRACSPPGGVACPCTSAGGTLHLVTEDSLNFTTAPRAPDDENDLPPFTFTLDGVEMTAVRPKEALLAQIAPISSRRTAPLAKIKLALDLLSDIVSEPGRTIMQDRLLDPEDNFDAQLALEILTRIGDHWKAIVDDRKAAKR
jgi:hypothetical protein